MKKETHQHSTQSDARPIIIIGAGMAGLAAGRYLVDAGQHVVLLEGRDRVGGRLCTRIIEQSTPALDVGAAWIHGVEGNPITALCQQLGLETQSFGSDLLLYGMSGTTLNFNVHGRPLTQSELLQRHDAFTAVYRHLEQSTPDEVKGASLDKWLDHLLSVEKIDPALHPLLHYVVARITEDDFGADIHDIAGWALNEGDAFEGGDDVILNGYGSLLRKLSPGLDIRFGEVVQHIHYDDQGACVVTNNGKYDAAAVIVTVPLGVLKAETITFSPALPDDKLAAIKRIGMGQYGKLFLCFEERFWPENIEILCHEEAPKGHFNAWYAMNHLNAGPVLCALFGGDVARTFEEMCPEQVVAEALTSLQSLFDDNVPALKGYHLTRWGQDRFALGAYSYPHKDMHPDDRSHLAAPVSERLYFAGEATSERYSATVHGAYLSGIDAAQTWLAAKPL